MPDRNVWAPADAESYAVFLAELQEQGAEEKAINKQKDRKRISLSPQDRLVVLQKTGSRCHICGGLIEGNDWVADHIAPHSKGGENSVDNFLPAHQTCNHYKWDFTPEEIQEILKLGVFMRTQIVKRTKIGMNVAAKFVKHEQRRIERRKRQS